MSAYKSKLTYKDTSNTILVRELSAPKFGMLMEKMKEKVISSLVLQSL